MAVEQYSNLAQTTLGSGINNSVTSLTVASATAFPSAGNFRILIGTELLLVTAVSGTTFTVTRGVEGTTAASHSSGDTVSLIATAGGLSALAEVAARREAYGSRPSAAMAGRLFLPTDGPGLQRDDGSAWAHRGWMDRFVAPDDSLFSWINQGTCSIQATHGMIHVTAPPSNPNARVRKMTAPATPYTVTACFLINAVMADYSGAGLCFRQSSDGKLVSLYAWDDTSGVGGGVAVQKYAAGPVWSANYTVLQLTKAQPIWLQISDDGTNRISRYSKDGITFRVLHSVTRTDWLTANEIGFLVSNANATYTHGTTLLSWEVT